MPRAQPAESSHVGRTPEGQTAGLGLCAALCICATEPQRETIFWGCYRSGFLFSTGLVLQCLQRMAPPGGTWGSQGRWHCGRFALRCGLHSSFFQAGRLPSTDSPDPPAPKRSSVRQSTSDRVRSQPAVHVSHWSFLKCAAAQQLRKNSSGPFFLFSKTHQKVKCFHQPR